MRTPFESLWDYSDPAGTAEKFEAFKPQLSDDLNLTLQLMTQIARTHGLRAQFDEAHALLDDVEQNIPDGSEFDIVWIRLWLERGRSFNSSGHPADARSLFVQAYEKGKAIGADFYAVDAAHMLAIIEPPADQITWNEKAIDMVEQSEDEETKRWLGSLYNNLGWSLREQGENERALTVYQKGLEWQIANKPGSKNELIARWTIGRTLRALGRLDEALEIQHALEQIYIEQDEASGYTWEELGELYLLQGDSPTAAAYFAKAYDELSKDIWLQRNEQKRLERLKELSIVNNQ